MRIAICDDEQILRKQLESFIHEKNPDAAVSTFETGEALLQAAMQMSFDLILLDIGLPGMDGVEVAKRIRKDHNGTIIVFITADDSRVFEAFDVSALHYLRKPIDQNKLQQVYERAMQIIRDRETASDKQEEEILIKSGDQHIRLARKDILCIESKGRKLLIMDRSGKYEIYGVLGKWEDRLGDGFYRCHRSYLVGLRHVKSYDSESILLRGGIRVFLSRDRYANFVKVYMHFLQGQKERHV
ncbi:MAG: LytTR family DNA-binding domain-containing protein [Lachnospiraceae bacterium]|nr:LytTR family DNA-binding domain-containing protein [Lachnospiraceae bacterium]